MSEPVRSSSPFPNTSWSMVARAAHVRSSVRRRTLDALLRQYLPALRSYLAARRRISSEEAEDLVQGFLTSKVLEQQILRRADPARGKFRTFLMTALERYALDEWRKDTAAKRSPAGGRGPGPLDELAEADHPSAEAVDLFDLEWAKQAVDLAVARMRRECQAGGRTDVWGVFEARVLGPTLHDAEPVPYEELVRRFGFAAPEKAISLLTTGKRMFSRNLREVVAEYAEDEHEAEGELRRLKIILAGGA